jgi:hypothetical protein
MLSKLRLKYDELSDEKCRACGRFLTFEEAENIRHQYSEKGGRHERNCTICVLNNPIIKAEISPLEIAEYEKEVRKHINAYKKALYKKLSKKVSQQL